MLKKMIEERMTQIQRSMGRESEKRLALLEKENRALKDYAEKLEASLKKATETERAKQRVTRAVQTQDHNWVSL